MSYFLAAIVYSAIAQFGIAQFSIEVACAQQQTPAPPGPNPSVRASPRPSATPEQKPRKVYNSALAALEKHDLETAEKAFGEARDRAGPDRELRFRSAFDLAFTLASHADQLEKDKPEEALNTLKTAAAWFRDAIREQPQDTDARANLEIVLRRAQTLADAIEKKAGTLEAKLDRVLEDQRGLRDELRGLLQKIDASGAGNEPVSFQDAFRSLATWQRVLLSDTGALIARAGEELGSIESHPEKDRSDKDRMRLGELKNLITFLDRARQRMNDGRRLLQKLQGEAAHRATDGALRELSRAREQLLDPAAILRGLMVDQIRILEETTVLENGKKSALAVEKAPDTVPPPPAWLLPSYLAEREDDTRERTDELAQRFAATVEHGAGTTPAPGTLHEPGVAPVTTDRQTRRALEQIGEALPHLRDAARTMTEAGKSLVETRLDAAHVSERAALESLGRALEQLSGIKSLIELAYAEEQQAVMLLSPPGADASHEVPGAHGSAQPTPPPHSTPPLSTEERARTLDEGLARNRERLARLATLFGDEVEKLDEKAKSPAPDKPGAPNPAEQTKAERERYRLAEQERSAAAALEGRLAHALAAPGALHAPGPVEAPLPLARETLAHLETLRRLFFSIVEHLEELLREEVRGSDETAQAAAKKDPDERKRALGPLAESETGRSKLARALAAELGKQSQKTPRGGPDSNEQPNPAAQASRETDDAAAAMEDARGALGATTPDAESALKHEKDAEEHLAKAIVLLKPPGEQQSKPEDKNGQKKDEPENQVSREQAARRLQAVRDREASRQSERQRRTQAPSEPVEKDW